MTVRPVGAASPNVASAAISAKRSAQNAPSSDRFRNPLMTLNDLNSGKLAFMYSPISVAVASGDLRLRRNSGKVTSV